MQVRGSASAEQLMQVVQTARDTLTVRRVFGEAYVSGETTVIPVAKVMGGAGMGYGGSQQEPGDDRSSDRGKPQPAGPGPDGTGFEGEGGGGGLGLRLRPAGVYVIRGGDVQWQPALDVTRLALGGQALVAVGLLAWAFRRRR